jgi:serine protease Do
MVLMKKGLIIMLAICLGGATLGGGLGAGYAVANHFLPGHEIDAGAFESEARPVFSFDTVETTMIPIHVSSGNFAEIVREAGESVVSINVVSTVSNWFGGTRVAEGAGSGFIFAMDDKAVYIATNNHVIENVQAVSISLDDDESVEATVVGRDKDSDLAVLSVPKSVMDGLGVPYKAAKIGDSDVMAVGDSVVAIGNAMGEGQTATSGIISATNREITVERRKLVVMQTDAAINRGNSGGPLVNAEGEVIGINTAKLYASGVEGMGYSLPINEAMAILNDLLDDGTVDKPFIGISYMPIDEATKEVWSLPSVGVIIRNTVEGGPAHEAGLMARDIIISFGENEIVNDEDLRNALSAYKVGDTVKAVIYRGNDRMEFTVKIGNMNER